MKRIPQQINFAFQKAMNGKPGPVYLDLPGDVLYPKVEEAEVDWSYCGRPIVDARPYAEPKAINALVDAINKAQAADHRLGRRGALVAGLGRDARVRREGRHPVLHDPARPRRRAGRPPLFVSDDALDAFRDADLIIVLGTRMNYIIGHAAPPRFGADAKIARIEIDAEELGMSARNVDIPIVGDCKSVLQQLIDAVDGKTADRFPAGARRWPTARPRSARGPGGNYPTDGDIHPLRLCEEVKNFMKRDAILVVDGQEILNFGRQTIPTFTPGHRLNSGPFGTMGVGLPFAVGAKAAKPDTQVICLHGDGSFGQNAMELDTAVRHKMPILVRHQPQRRLDRRPGAQQARPRPRLHPLRHHGPRASAATANMSSSPKTSARPSNARRRRSTRAWSRWSTSRPTTAPAPRRCSSRSRMT